MHQFEYRALDSRTEKLIPVINIDFEEELINTGHAWRYFAEVTFLQHTGLRDSKGHEIYEGDILEAVFELLDGELKNIMDRGVVVKKDYAFQVKTFEGHHEPLHEWERLSEELKVLGNIYENPELLPEVTTQ